MQVLSIILNANVKIVNCHATTETSDLLGGLRPLRGRQQIILDMISKTKELIALCPNLCSNNEIPNFLLSPHRENGDDVEMVEELNNGIPSSPQLCDIMHSFCSNLWSKISLNRKNEDKRVPTDVHQNKKRKVDSMSFDSAKDIISEINKLFARSKSLFEWYDGPLVNAMKKGTFLLLDEMSLAEDAVLERLNSVLEPARTLVLAEKGGGITGDNANEGNEIIAHKNFRLFATMNPGK